MRLVFWTALAVMYAALAAALGSRR
jgi:hypothetical protein